MPRPTMPPTPTSSTDITGKENTKLNSSEKPFNLPPPAIKQKGRASHNKPSAPRSIQPANPTYSLPPPPTRSRRIIQMNPQSESQDGAKAAGKAVAEAANQGLQATPNQKAAPKKQPTSTSAAGKKIARKTAHSVIERRRRSKMNEEFATLQAMIPACTGQEMHKLSILQASIDYLRYLEGCVTDLRAANNALSTPLVQPQAPPLRTSNLSLTSLDDNEDDEEDQDGNPADEDETMADAAPASGSATPLVSPQKNGSYATPMSIANSPRVDAQYSFGHSLPSPAYGPQTRLQQSQPSGSGHANAPTLTSPAIMPSKDEDEEATEVLLSLNKDRRYSTSDGKVRRGLSVKDLLTH